MTTRVLVTVLGTLTACLAAGYGVLFTMLDDYREVYGIPEGQLGLVIGIGFFSGFVAQILIAPFADRGLARRLVVVGLVMNIAGLMLMAVGTTFWTLSAGRLVMGIGVGTAVPAVRRIVIMADPANLGHNLGRLLALDVAGFAIGPLIAAVLVGPFGIPAPFVVVAVISTILLFLVLWIEVNEAEPGVVVLDDTGQPVAALAPTSRLAFDLLKIRPFAGAVVLGCSVFVMIGAFDALWAVALTDLEAPEWAISVGITIFALPLVLFGTFGGRLAQRVGPFRVATFGLIVGAVAMALYGTMPTAAGMLVVAIFHSLTDGVSIASTGVAAGMTVPPDRQAGAQGLLGGAQTLSAGLVATMTGVLYQEYGRSTAYVTAACVMLVLVGIGRWLIADEFGRRGDPDGPEVPHIDPGPVAAPVR